MSKPAFSVGMPIALCLFTVAAPAADTVTQPVIVTATRTAQTADSALAPVTVITREDIERRQPQSMVELLRTRTGINMSRRGGLGQDTSLFLRGTNSDHALVLIDGVRVSSPTSGGFAWQHLSPEQVERIEIVRGPRASLYGSDAIGGVIQIFTRQTEGVTAQIGAGADNTYRGQAGYGHKGRQDFHVLASGVNTDGFSATNSNASFFDPDADGYRNRSLTARWSAPLVANHRLSAAFWHSEGDIEFDTGTNDSRNQSLSLSLDGELSERWAQTVRLGYARDDLDTDSAAPTAIDGKRLTASWQHDLSLGQAHLLSAGLDYYHDEGENIDLLTNTVSFDESVSNRAAFVSLQSMLGSHDLQLSVRHDMHSEFGDHTTGQAGWGHPLGEQFRITASYGTAFRAPTLNDLFSPGFFGGLFAGNPDLDPERSRSTEVGLDFHSARHPSRRASINLFYTRIDDLIANEGANFQSINVDEATIKGLEVEYFDRFGNLDIDANLVLQRPRDEADDSRLLRRPDEKLSVTLGHPLPRKGYASAEILLVGDRADFNTELPGYGLVNLAGHYPLHRDVELEIRLENLLDKSYETVSGYNTQDRSLMVSLEYSPR